jgi:hypothetical protein
MPRTERMFAYNPCMLRLTRSCLVLRAYMLPESPDLCGVCWTGISQLMFIIKPCAQLAPHHHPRADELLTVIEGAGLG